MTTRQDALAAVDRMETAIENGRWYGDHPRDLALVRAALAPELPADLARIQARADAATELYATATAAASGDPVGEELAVWASRIATFRSQADVPALLAEVAALRAAPQLTAEELRDIYAHAEEGVPLDPKVPAYAKLRAIAEQTNHEGDKK
jgi:hypothetical protein